eukprot:GEMP01001264.1.p1 GENE.GEMP01001264.1~~GEMP01001264.1.p1  ORF type:complete len:1310 (+),score=318.21 GEMP01001264.1:350-4279(+)
MTTSEETAVAEGIQQSSESLHEALDTQYYSTGGFAAKYTEGKKNVETRAFPLREAVPSGVRKHTNALSTTRYNLLTFVPMNLFEQFFLTPINLYFLAMCVLQTFPAVSITNGLPTTAAPLSFVIFIAMIKDAAEDYHRYLSDKTENNRTTRRVSPTESGVVEVVPWRKLKVGDTLLLKNLEFIPADCVLCATSDSSGLAYVETANLDGETNLKVRSTPVASMQVIDLADPTGENVAKAWDNTCGEMQTEAPNGSLYTFTALMTLTAPSKEIIPLEAANILLRGCKLRSTDWAVGKIVYTGPEMKIQMNQTQKAKKKRTKVEKMIMRILAAMLCIAFVLCVLGAIINAVIVTNDDKTRRYLNFTLSGTTTPNGALEFLLRFGTALLIFVNFIPISLMVTLSMIKNGQVFLLRRDRTMFWKDSGVYPKTSDLNEELGQVEYVFSDKTGTLTQNLMEFRKCCVGGKTYGKGLTEIRRQVLKREGASVPSEPVAPKGSKVTPSVNFVDLELGADLLDPEKKRELYDFFLHLAINHTVLPEVREDGTKVYSASSPDEGALVYGAQHFGFNLVERRQTTIKVQIPDGSTVKVAILATIEFTSDRKRSSVVARFTHPLAQKEVTYLYTKGADTMVKAILKPDVLATHAFTKVEEYTQEYAVDGLRTLMLAGKAIDPEEFTKWLALWDRANQSVSNREKKIAQTADLLETHLDIHGITGIEDRLQGEVSETIELMQSGGIKVWMLTGDKVETAINIGIATGLLEPFVDPGRRPIFNWDAFAEESEALATQNVAHPGSVTFQTPGELCFAKFQRTRKEAKRTLGCFEAIVVDGACLSVLLKYPSEFLETTRDTHAVLCCRVSPDQKGQIVRLYKKIERKVTLAIGDGANDCNMIRSAHIGIGIRGEEGLQAFNVSDFGIGQFKFLGSLLIFHGRNFYRRQSITVLYTFYKSTFVVIPQYLLGWFALWGGPRLYPDLLYQGFNTFFTALPIIAFSWYDKEFTREQSFQFAHLYKLGPERYYLNTWRVARWIANGFFQGIVVLVIVFTATDGTILNLNGSSQELPFVGVLIFLSVVVVANLKIVLESYTIVWLTYVFWTMTFGILVFLTVLFNFVPHFGVETFGILNTLFSSPMAYVIFFVAIFVSLLRDVNWKIIQYHFYPTPIQIAQKQILAQEQRALKTPKQYIGIERRATAQSVDGTAVNVEEGSSYFPQPHGGGKLPDSTLPSSSTTPITLTFPETPSVRESGHSTPGSAAKNKTKRRKRRHSTSKSPQRRNVMPLEDTSPPHNAVTAEGTSLIPSDNPARHSAVRRRSGQLPTS